MATSSTIYTAVIIFMVTTLIIGSIKTTETNVVEPLSSQHFSQELRQLLSPDIFTQTDPFHYLLEKIAKLPFMDLYPIIIEVNRHLNTREKVQFPADYQPNAKLLRTLLNLIIHLVNVQRGIHQIQRDKKIKPDFQELDTRTLDPELSALFSSDILSDAYPPVVLVDKLLVLPENSFERIANKLTDCLRNNRVIRNHYYFYTVSLREFLRPFGQSKTLTDMQRYIAEMQVPKLSTPPAVSGQLG
ncbi:uncharacterized protein LOC135848865 [Planococcus citri]|uniref:uncharacterized protein LOC135848865 n=1 Tax=Planococcus citri TaxID=170843 RepID=UPI0031F8E70E